MKNKKKKAGGLPPENTTGHQLSHARYPLRSSSLSSDTLVAHQSNTENPNCNIPDLNLEQEPIKFTCGSSLSHSPIPIDPNKIDVFLPREILKYPHGVDKNPNRVSETLTQNPNSVVDQNPPENPSSPLMDAELDSNTMGGGLNASNENTLHVDRRFPASELVGQRNPNAETMVGVNTTSVSENIDTTKIPDNIADEHGSSSRSKIVGVSEIGKSAESQDNTVSDTANSHVKHNPVNQCPTDQDGNSPTDEEVIKMTDKQFDDYLRSKYPNLNQPIVVDSSQMSKDYTDPVEFPLQGEPNSPTKIQEPMTFANLFKEAENIRKKGTLRFIPPAVTESGIKRPVIPRDLLLKQAENWSYTLIGHFIGKRPAFPFVNFHANRLWKKFGLVDVLLNDQGCFYFKFKSDQGLQFVFENGPWLFNDIPILLKKWQPDCWFEKPKPTEVSLWVNIYDLPVTLWDYEIMSHIVSAIGRPIAVDRYTAEMCEKKTGRAVFARVLVEVSAEQDIPKCIEADILGTIRKFRLQFNWTPTRCSHCKIFGHTFDDCTVRNKSAEEMEAIIGKVTEPHGEGTSEATQEVFQQPKRRKRRSNRSQSNKGVVIGQSKPKFQYVPKKNQLPDKDKGKKVTFDTGSTQVKDAVDYYVPAGNQTSQVNIDATDSSIPAENQTSPVPSHAPNSSPNFETRNKFEGLDGMPEVSSGNPSSKEKKNKKKDAEADPWDKANLYRRFKAVYGDGIPNPYAAYVEVDQLDDSDDVEDET